ncbi:Protein kinase domain-containing protein [Forsythia ovata]|uniref:Protein kinase domain-containing protein n=1 Tax=Forsythia ovata TaxID=205694 RepID=A0ABD1WNR4_9LAMI
MAAQQYTAYAEALLRAHAISIGLGLEEKILPSSKNYNAKISDFVLAKLGPSEGNSHVTTRVKGTYGYATPEYIATGNLYVKSDVYGFGGVLLEMLTGLRVIDLKRPIDQRDLVVYAKPFLSQKRKLMSIMDARMEGQYSSKAALQASQLTLRCLESEPRKRPSMKEVKSQPNLLETQQPKQSYGSPEGTAQILPKLPKISEKEAIKQLTQWENALTQNLKVTELSYINHGGRIVTLLGLGPHFGRNK